MDNFQLPPLEHFTHYPTPTPGSKQHKTNTKRNKTKQNPQVISFSVSLRCAPLQASPGIVGLFSHQRSGGALGLRRFSSLSVGMARRCAAAQDEPKEAGRNVGSDLTPSYSHSKNLTPSYSNSKNLTPYNHLQPPVSRFLG